MPRPLTPKQEAFAHKYVETGNATESYRFAYPSAIKWPLTTIYPEASRLLANPKVSARIETLQERALAKSDASADWIISTAVDTIKLALVSGQLSVVAPNLSLLAKRHPEFSEKHDIKADVRMQALQAVANMTEEQLLRLAGEDI